MRITTPAVRIGFLLSLGITSLIAAAPQRREPWQWDNAERIVARADRTAASERVKAAHANGASQHALQPLAMAHISRELDVIDGKEHPELFLPTELFETLVRDGLIHGDLWREFYAKRLSAAGLPADFWERLETISQPYTTDLRHAQELLEHAGASSAEKAAVEGKIAGLSPTLCRERYDALVSARRAFGTSLDRLMYTYVAGKTTVFTDELPQTTQLEAEERGCR